MVKLKYIWQAIDKIGVLERPHGMLFCPKLLVNAIYAYTERYDSKDWRHIFESKEDHPACAKGIAKIMVELSTDDNIIDDLKKYQDALPGQVGGKKAKEDAKARNQNIADSFCVYMNRLFPEKKKSAPLPNCDFAMWICYLFVKLYGRKFSVDGVVGVKAREVRLGTKLLLGYSRFMTTYDTDYYMNRIAVNSNEPEDPEMEINEAADEFNAFLASQHAIDEPSSSNYGPIEVLLSTKDKLKKKLAKVEELRLQMKQISARLEIETTDLNSLQTLQKAEEDNEKMIEKIRSRYPKCQDYVNKLEQVLHHYDTCSKKTEAPFTEQPLFTPDRVSLAIADAQSLISKPKGMKKPSTDGDPSTSAKGKPPTKRNPSAGNQGVKSKHPKSGVTVAKISKEMEAKVAVPAKKAAASNKVHQKTNDSPKSVAAPNDAQKKVTERHVSPIKAGSSKKASLTPKKSPTQPAKKPVDNTTRTDMKSSSAVDSSSSVEGLKRKSSASIETSSSTPNKKRLKKGKSPVAITPAAIEDVVVDVPRAPVHDVNYGKVYLDELNETVVVENIQLYGWVEEQEKDNEKENEDKKEKEDENKKEEDEPQETEDKAGKQDESAEEAGKTDVVTESSSGSSDTSSSSGSDSELESNAAQTQHFDKTANVSDDDDEDDLDISSTLQKIHDIAKSGEGDKSD